MKARTFTNKWDQEEKVNESGDFSFGTGLRSSPIHKKWWFWLAIIAFSLLMYFVFGKS